MNAMVGPSRVESLSVLGDIRHFFKLINNYVEVSFQLHRRMGDAIALRLPVPHISLCHPRHITHVFKDNLQNYLKSEDYQGLKPLLGKGIFIVEGEAWQERRKLLSPEFRASVMSRYLSFIVRDVELLFRERWEPSIGGAPRDIAEDMMFLTLRVLGDTLFGQDFVAYADAVGRALETCLTQATFRSFTGFLLPYRLPTIGNIRSWRAQATLDRIVGELIQGARAAGAGGEMIARLAAATDDTGRPVLSDALLVDEVKSMILAGHETTSLALSWSFYLLSQHPEQLARLEAEVDAVLGGRSPEVSDIAKLPYTRMVVQEALRLYPPVPLVTRRAIEPDEIDGVQIPAGTKLSLPIFATHRHPDYWLDPDRFDPERFTPGRASTIPPGAYAPFLLGRRACLGEHFAMLEGVTALAMIISRYRLVRANDTPIGTRPVVTLRMDAPLWMRVERRAG